jgi:hypothetical protein
VHEEVVVLYKCHNKLSISQGNITGQCNKPQLCGVWHAQALLRVGHTLTTRDEPNKSQDNAT